MLVTLAGHLPQQTSLLRRQTAAAGSMNRAAPLRAAVRVQVRICRLHGGWRRRALLCCCCTPGVGARASTWPHLPCAGSGPRPLLHGGWLVAL